MNVMSRPNDAVAVLELGQAARAIEKIAELVARPGSASERLADISAIVSRLAGPVAPLPDRVRDFDAPVTDGDELPGCIVGSSRAMMAAVMTLRRVAPTSLSVLLLGESGTGKGVLARAIHDLSPRRGAPFIKVNSAALPESLLESELFGHEKGAFTGATALRKGRFELADGGTLFLDEIGDISPAFQAKLLRVLQEREFERVGGTTTLRADVRIIAATNCNLEAAVAAGRFRSDLYFRLNTVPIRLPALRDRREDIPLFATRVLEQFNRDNATQLSFASDTLAVMAGCAFPGNVRELENCVRRTAILANSSVIKPCDLACRSDGCAAQMMLATIAAHRVEPPFRPSGETHHEGSGANASGRVRTPGRNRILDPERLTDALRRSGWSQARAARLLGLSSRQVGYALKRHGIKVERL